MSAQQLRDAILKIDTGALYELGNEFERGRAELAQFQARVDVLLGQVAGAWRGQAAEAAQAEVKAISASVSEPQQGAAESALRTTSPAVSVDYVKNQVADMKLVDTSLWGQVSGDVSAIGPWMMGDGYTSTAQKAKAQKQELVTKMQSIDTIGQDMGTSVQGVSYGGRRTPIVAEPKGDLPDPGAAQAMALGGAGIGFGSMMSAGPPLMTGSRGLTGSGGLAGRGIGPVVGGAPAGATGLPAGGAPQAGTSPAANGAGGSAGIGGGQGAGSSSRPGSGGFVTPGPGLVGGSSSGSGQSGLTSKSGSAAASGIRNAVGAEGSGLRSGSTMNRSAAAEMTGLRGHEDTPHSSTGQRGGMGSAIHETRVGAGGQLGARPGEGMMGPTGAPGNRNEDNELNERPSWLIETDNVWGTGELAVPAVIE